MLTGPHRRLHIPVVRAGVTVGVGVRVRGAVPARTGPIGVEKRPP